MRVDWTAIDWTLFREWRTTRSIFENGKSISFYWPRCPIQSISQPINLLLWTPHRLEPAHQWFPNLNVIRIHTDPISQVVYVRCDLNTLMKPLLLLSFIVSISIMDWSTMTLIVCSPLESILIDFHDCPFRVHFRAALCCGWALRLNNMYELNK